MEKIAESKLTAFMEDIKAVNRVMAMWIYSNKNEDKLSPLYAVLKDFNRNLAFHIKKEEIGFLVCREISNFLEDRYEFIDNGKIEDIRQLFTEAELNKIKKRILKGFKKLPYEYLMCLRFNTSNKGFVDIDCKINDEINLKGIDASTLPKEGFNANSPSQLSIYKSKKNDIVEGESLAVFLRFFGYVEPYAPTFSLNESEKKLKTFISLAIILDLLKINRDKYIQFYFQKSVFIYDKDMKLVRSVELNHDLSEALHRVVLGSGLQDLNQSGLSTRTNLFKAKFSEARFFFEAQSRASSEEEVNYFNKLENIMQWFLQGISSTDSSIGFVSLICAFESFFLTTPKDNEKTKSLAGKCGYFLAQNFKDREEIIKDVFEIYNLRNRVVHEGYKLNNTTDIVLFNKLLRYLQASIKKEIKSLGSKS